MVISCSILLPTLVSPHRPPAFSCYCYSACLRAFPWFCLCLNLLAPHLQVINTFPGLWSDISDSMENSVAFTNILTLTLSPPLVCVACSAISDLPSPQCGFWGPQGCKGRAESEGGRGAGLVQLWLPIGRLRCFVANSPFPIISLRPSLHIIKVDCIWCTALGT